jgi:hypothetical protein
MATAFDPIVAAIGDACNRLLEISLEKDGPWPGEKEFL